MHRQVRSFPHGSVDAHTHLMKSKIKQQLFCPIDHAKLFLIDRFSVNETGSQTGKGLLVPGRKAELFGQLTDLRLGQLRMAQRTLNAKLFDCQ